MQLVWSRDFRKLQLCMGQKLEQVVLGLYRAASYVEKKGHRLGRRLGPVVSASDQRVLWCGANWFCMGCWSGAVAGA